MSFEEKFPDEIILEICRYLTPAEILLAFAQLNLRLNRTISDFIRDVRFDSILSLKNFQFLFSTIFPSISPSIDSLTISNERIPCLTTIFFDYFPEKFSSNLKFLNLISVNIGEIYSFLTRLPEESSIENLKIDCRDDDCRTQVEIFGYKIVQILFYNSHRFRSIEIRGDFSFHLSQICFQTANFSSRFSLKNLTLNVDSIDVLPNLLKDFLQLEKLGVEIKISPIFYLHNCPTLENVRRLEFHTKISTIELNDVVHLFKYFPNVKSFLLNVETTDAAFFDGNQLKNLVRRFDEFQFSIGPATDKNCLNSFLTPFWLEEKRWATQIFYQVEPDEFEGNFRLCSIPFAFDKLSVTDLTALNLLQQNSSLKTLRHLSLRSISDLNAIEFLRSAPFVNDLSIGHIYDDDDDYRTDEEEDITDLDVVPLPVDPPVFPSLRFVENLHIDDLPFADFHFVNRLIRVTNNLTRLSLQKSYLVEFLRHSTGDVERLEQLEILLEEFWSIYSVENEFSFILQRFPRLKILQISLKFSQKNETKLLKEILQTVWKFGQNLRCLHIVLPVIDSADVPHRQNDLETIRRHLSNSKNCFHFEIRRSSLTICS